MSFSFVFCKTWTMQWRCNRQREELNVCNFKVLTQNLTCLIWFFVGIIFCIDNCRICNSMFNVVSLEVGEVQMQRGGEQIQSRYITIICAFNFKMFFISMGSFLIFGFNFQFFQVHFFIHQLFPFDQSLPHILGSKLKCFLLLSLCSLLSNFSKCLFVLHWMFHAS
jgi:hypothetical protein